MLLHLSASLHVIVYLFLLGWWCSHNSQDARYQTFPVLSRYADSLKALIFIFYYNALNIQAWQTWLRFIYSKIIQQCHLSFIVTEILLILGPDKDFKDEKSIKYLLLHF